MVSGEDLSKQRVIGFPFTAYHMLRALRLELCVMGEFRAKSVGPGFFAQLSSKDCQKQATTYNNSVPVTRTKCVLSPIDSVPC